MEVHGTMRWKPYRPIPMAQKSWGPEVSFPSCGPLPVSQKTNTLMMHSQTNFFVASADRQGEGGGGACEKGSQARGLLWGTSLGSQARWWNYCLFF